MMMMVAPLHFFCSEQREPRPLVPMKPGHISLYVCGPTVYNDAHLGHARCYITWDVLFRTLQFMGYTVTYARNITDVDDKILQRAQEEGLTPEAVVHTYTARFHEDMAALNVLPPTLEPRATEHIPDIQAMIQTLMEKGHAYGLEDGVYFKTASMPEYGRLAKKPKDAIQAGARVDIKHAKHHPSDFALWKCCAKDEYGWPSPWGYGRPGWHIECSAMNARAFGSRLDIHAGGADLMFPHHENEIAQSECCTGHTPYVGLWMHNGFVNVDGEKMSKSLGNFATIRDLMTHYDANTLRYFMLTHHYRSPVDFTPEALEGAQNRVRKLEHQLQQVLNQYPFLSNDYRFYFSENLQNRYQTFEASPFHGFVEALKQDLNTPRALAVLGSAFKQLKQTMPDEQATRETLALLLGMCQVLGLNFSHLEPLDAPAQTGSSDMGHLIYIDCLVQPLELFDIVIRRYLPHNVEDSSIEALQQSLQELLDIRRNAKQQRDFATSDAIRHDLETLGLRLTDLPGGYTRIEGC
jgi:cysteinyl-tRNA synthetase